MQTRHSTDTFNVLLALADTLGYCAGYLGKSCGPEFWRNFGDILLSDAEVAELLSHFALNHTEGRHSARAAEQAEREMQDGIEVGIREIR